MAASWAPRRNCYDGRGAGAGLGHASGPRDFVLAGGAVADRRLGGRRYALDAEEASGDGEWPVVEVTEQGVDWVGTFCLRFLHVLCAELASVGVPAESAISLCEARCHRDPGLADHWLDFAELLEPEGRAAEIDATLAAALRAATPPTPALMLAIGMRAVRIGDQEGALRAFSDAIALEPIGARDDDARLDAAALVSVRRPSGATRPRSRRPALSSVRPRWPRRRSARRSAGRARRAVRITPPVQRLAPAQASRARGRSIG